MNILKSLQKATDTFSELISLYVITIVSSAALYSFFEHKKFWDSLWWACVTAMTVGYGDLYPVTTGGRIVAVALMNAVPLIIIPLMISLFLEKVVEEKNAFTHEEQEQLKKDIKEIKVSLHNNNPYRK